jgi:hypothetical protein
MVDLPRLEIVPSEPTLVNIFSIRVDKTAYDFKSNRVELFKSTWVELTENFPFLKRIHENTGTKGRKSECSQQV